MPLPGSSWSSRDPGRGHRPGVGLVQTALLGSAIAIALAGGLIFRSLSLGELYTCGVVAPLGSPTGPSAAPGTIYCWGDNAFGQVGNGAAAVNAPLLVPTRVSFQP